MTQQLSSAQREVLQHAKRAGETDRWDWDGSRMRTLVSLVNRGLLAEKEPGTGTRGLVITDAGREALK